MPSPATRAPATIVVTDLTAERLELARHGRATLAVDVREQDYRLVQRELGMTEGFDIGLEMSGNPDALREMIANMAHGGRIAVLGIPSEESCSTSTPSSSHAHPQGITGREMYETWYQMTVMLQSGLEIAPVITHRFHQDSSGAVAVRQSGKVVLDWTDT